MALIGCLVLGVATGAIARAIHPGRPPGGLTGMIVVGLVGAIVGATIAPAIGVGEIRTFFSLGTWVFAVLTASGFLALYTAILGHDDDRGRLAAGRS
jgi:uncharacterized membrane protein YeaQ/YmgE (transglycosylase-associated protein family)